jgi:thiol:disulfide interchange protein DsbC
MKIIKFGVTLLLGAVIAMAHADTTPPEAQIKKLVEQRIGDGAKIDSVTKTNFLGLYEVRMGADILYTDAQAKYVLFGAHVIDLETHKDLTKDRIEEANRINFSELPLDSAIKMVKGDGKRVIAVFEDPNCGYCKHLRHTLAQMDNITVYTFMYNILADDSSVKARNVWCTKDRLKAWDDWMLNGKAPAVAAANCTATPNEKVLELGKQYHVTGTPTIFFTDGTRFPGAVDAAMLEEKWSSIN